MSGTITLALRTAQSGLLTSQAAVDAVASNIANVNTEGYSRKVVNQETRILAGVGAGVQIKDFTRAVDDGLLKDLRREYSSTYKLDVQTNYFDRLDATLGTPESNTSIAHIMNELNKAAESLAVSPDKALEQSEFIRWAEEVALKLNAMSTEIQSLRTQSDISLSAGVDEVNDLLAEIESMNDKIIRNSAVGHDITDLEDRRDLALSELSKWMDISYYTRGNGDVVVFSGSGNTLVDRTAKPLTHTAITSVGATTTYSEGDITPIYAGDQVADNDITTTITGGRLAGLIEQRDQTLPNLQAQLDELSSQLRDSMNLAHNRGTAYPGLTSYAGTRTFIDSANQQIKLKDGGDVAISLFDTSGNQHATTTLDTIMTDGAYGTGQQTSGDFWNIDEVAAALEDWLQGNGAGSASVSIDTSGKMNIETSTTTLFLAFRDQESSTAGSDAADASIEFDSDGDGDADSTHTGFANFFGLNDLYTDATTDNIHESAVLSGNWASTGATLNFYDSSGGTGSAMGSVTISANSSLDTVISTINDADIGVVASKVPDGSGYRLRLMNDNGRNMVVTQGSSDSLLTDIAMQTAETRSASSIAIRSDLKLSPSLVSTGSPKWSSDRNEYFMTPGDNSVAQDMAETLTNKSSFATSGGLLARNESFAQYAASVLSEVATKGDTNADRLETADTLSNSLELKAANFSGVNLDEEMSNLMLYQQAYSASAQVISVVQKLFDTLDNLIR